MIEVWRDLWRSSGLTPSAQAGPHRAGFPWPCPDAFWTPPMRETPLPLWATCSSAESPSALSDMNLFHSCKPSGGGAEGARGHSFSAFPHLRVCSYRPARDRLCLCLHRSWGLGVLKPQGLWEDPVYLSCHFWCWLLPITPPLGGTALRQQHTRENDRLTQPQGEVWGAPCSHGPPGLCPPPEAQSGPTPPPWQGQLLPHLLGNVPWVMWPSYLRTAMPVWTVRRSLSMCPVPKHKTWFQ